MNEIRNDPTAVDRMRRYRARQKGVDVPVRKPGPRPRRKQTMIPASPSRGYPLDFRTPVQYAATELEKAGQRGATVAELESDYSHPIVGDLSRVKLLHGLDTDMQAQRFLIDRAVGVLYACGYLKDARRSGAYRLAVPFDDIRINGEPLSRYESYESS